MREMAVARADAGLHWAKGETKDTHPGLAGVSEKLLASGRLWRADALAKARVTHDATVRQDPSGMQRGLRIRASKTEKLFGEWLGATGRRFVFQYPIVLADDVVFVDYFLPASNLAVELCKMRQRFALGRARQIVSAGITPLGVVNRLVLTGRLDDVEKQIAAAERGEFHPSTLRECWMGCGPGHGDAADESDIDQPLR
jgi:hypothetical protein